MSQNYCKSLNLFTIASLIAILGLVGYSIAQQQPTSSLRPGSQANYVSPQPAVQISRGTPKVNPAQLETITLGAGCFWCIEAVYQEVDGVVSVTSGYSNGKVVNPTYDQVCSGETGCVEVAQIVYDPSKVSLGKILHVFWRTHDPTSLNKQGLDSGTQYRSGIYYHTQQQKEYAELYKRKLNEVKAFEKPVVTEILPVQNFSIAENYHQNYFRDNPNAGYCRNVIRPKMAKFRHVFADAIKEPSK